MRKSYPVLEIIIGILLITLGLASALSPEKVTDILAYIAGIITIIYGISDLILFIHYEKKANSRIGIALISGIISMICGVLFIFNTQETKMLFAMLLPIWILINSLTRALNVGIIGPYIGLPSYYFTMFTSIIGIILSLNLLAFPRLSLLTITFSISIYLFLSGASLICCGLEHLSKIK